MVGALAKAQKHDQNELVLLCNTSTLDDALKLRRMSILQRIMQSSSRRTFLQYEINVSELKGTTANSNSTLLTAAGVFLVHHRSLSTR